MWGRQEEANEGVTGHCQTACPLTWRVSKLEVVLVLDGIVRFTRRFYLYMGCMYSVPNSLH